MPPTQNLHYGLMQKKTERLNFLKVSVARGYGSLEITALKRKSNDGNIAKWGLK